MEKHDLSSSANIPKCAFPYSIDTIAYHFANREDLVQLIRVAVREELAPFAKQISKCSSSTNRMTEAFLALAKAYNGDTPASPHVRNSKNERVVAAAIARRWELINELGRDERMATTDACNEIEAKMGRGTYKTSESFRDAVATKIRKMQNLGLVEVEYNRKA